MTPQRDPRSEDVGRELVALREELHVMAEEVEGAVRSSSLDLRDRWNRLKPRLEEFEERSRAASYAKAAHLRRTGLHLRERLEKIRVDCQR